MFITCFLKGSVSIDNLDEIKDELFEAMLLSDLLLINIEEVETIDFEGIGLLCAINRSATIRGKRVELVGATNDEFFTQVVSAGFSPKGCVDMMNHACLWGMCRISRNHYTASSSHRRSKVG